MGSFFVKARVFPIAASVIRFAISFLLVYLLLFVVTFISERFTMNRVNVSAQNGQNSMMLSADIQKEFDANMSQLILEEFLDSGEMALIEMKKKSPTQAEKRRTKNIYVWERAKSSYALDEVHQMMQKGSSWQTVKKGFVQATGLLFVSQLLMLLLIATIRMLRSMLIYPKDRYISRGFLIFFATVPIFLIAILPDPYTVVGARPGYFLVGREGSEGFYLIWQYLFIISFGGISLQSILSAVLGATPEEHLNYYRGSAINFTSFRLAMVRAAEELKAYVAFYVIAVLYCLGVVTEAYSIASFVRNSTNLSKPIFALQSTILFSVVVIALTFLGQRFFMFVREAFLPLNQDQGVR